MLPGGCRTVEWSLTLATVEAGKMSAGEHGPDHAVAINIHSARREALYGGLRIVPWHFVYFRERGFCRIRSRIQPHDSARETESRAPDGAVGGAWSHCIETNLDAFIFRRIDGLIRLHVIIALAVAVGVQDEWSPALPHFRVQPANLITSGITEPQSVVRILGEHQVLRAGAHVD